MYRFLDSIQHAKKANSVSPLVADVKAEHLQAYFPTEFAQASKAGLEAMYSFVWDVFHTSHVGPGKVVTFCRNHERQATGGNTRDYVSNGKMVSVFTHWKNHGRSFTLTTSYKTGFILEQAGENVTVEARAMIGVLDDIVCSYSGVSLQSMTKSFFEKRYGTNLPRNSMSRHAAEMFDFLRIPLS